MPGPGPRSLTIENLANHTRSNPPSHRRTVQDYLIGLPAENKLFEPAVEDAPTERADASQSAHNRLLSSDPVLDTGQPATMTRSCSKLVRGMRSKRDFEATLPPPPKSSASDGMQRSPSPVLLPRVPARAVEPPAVPISFQQPATATQEHRQPSALKSARERRNAIAAISVAGPPQAVPAVTASRQAQAGASRLSEIAKPLQAYTKHEEDTLRHSAEHDGRDLGISEGEGRKKRLKARKERRRAKALIVKDRTGPSAPVKRAVEAERKRKHALVEEEPHVRRGLKRRREKSAKAEDDPASDDSGAEQGRWEEGLDIVAMASKKKAKRSKGVSKSMLAVRKASDPSAKIVENPLARTSNIGAVSRLTLKSKSGIYNQGQSSGKFEVSRTKKTNILPDLAFNERPFLEQTPQLQPQPPSETDISSLTDIEDLSPYKARKRSMDILYNLPKKTTATSTRPLTTSADTTHRGDQQLPFPSAKLVSGRPVFKRSKLDSSEGNNLADSQARRSPRIIHNQKAHAHAPAITSELGDERSSQISAASRKRRQQLREVEEAPIFPAPLRTESQQQGLDQDQAQDQPPDGPVDPPQHELTLDEQLAFFDFPNQVDNQDHGPTASFGTAIVRPRPAFQIPESAAINQAQALNQSFDLGQNVYDRPEEANIFSSQSPIHQWVSHNEDINTIIVPQADWLFSPTPPVASQHNFEARPIQNQTNQVAHTANFETGLEGFEDFDELPDEDLASDINLEQQQHEEGIMVVASSDPDHDNEHNEICRYDPQDHCCSSDLEERAMECQNDLYSTGLLEDDYRDFNANILRGHYTSPDRHAQRTMRTASSPPHRTHNIQIQEGASSSKAIDLDDPAPFRQGRAALFARGALAASLTDDHPPLSSRQKQGFWKPYRQ